MKQLLTMFALAAGAVLAMTIFASCTHAQCITLPSGQQVCQQPQTFMPASSYNQCTPVQPVGYSSYGATNYGASMDAYQLALALGFPPGSRVTRISESRSVPTIATPPTCSVPTAVAVQQTQQIVSGGATTVNVPVPVTLRTNPVELEVNPSTGAARIVQQVDAGAAMEARLQAIEAGLEDIRRSLNRSVEDAPPAESRGSDDERDERMLQLLESMAAKIDDTQDQVLRNKMMLSTMRAEGKEEFEQLAARVAALEAGMN